MSNELKNRFSNAISWLGFTYPNLLILSWMIDEATGDDNLFDLLSFSGWYSYNSTDFFISIAVFSVCATINYLIVGKFRFIPFKISINSPNISSQTKGSLKMVGIVVLFFIVMGFMRLIIRELF